MPKPPPPVPRAAEGDAHVKETLERFQDLKFGLMVHWGTYSVWGAVESWPIVDAEPYGRDALPAWYASRQDSDVFMQRYFALNRQFCPTHFDPDSWAEAAADAGMNYFVFTTKHHDGFCMFDTRTTSYRTTHPSCPFHSHPLANVTGAVLEAFRRRGFQVGTYFSKADWHHADYWNRDLPRRRREVNYDPATSPQAWSRFVAFTHRQIEELMTLYGPVAILWLDADWVRAPSEDIRMAELVAMARRHQPGLLVVDRGVGGRFEDYKTPEQAIPERPPAGPWESCITMAEQWSFRCNDLYKSSRQLIHMLARIVAGGGNLLLNVGPRPDGRLPREALTRLAEIGSWLRVNAAAIYGTRPVHRSTTGPLCLTRSKTTLYAICLAEEGHDTPPARIVVPAVRNATSVELLGVPGPLAWQCGPTGLTAELPDRVRHAQPCRHAWTLAISGATTDPTAAT